MSNEEFDYKLKPDCPTTLVPFEDFGAGLLGEVEALEDLLDLEDLEAVGRLVGLLVVGLTTGELVGGLLLGSSPSPQTSSPDASSPQTKPGQHVPKPNGSSVRSSQGSPKLPH